MSMSYCISFCRVLPDGSFYRSLFAEDSSEWADKAVASLEADPSVVDVVLTCDDLAESSPVVHLGTGYTHHMIGNGWDMCNWGIALRKDGGRYYIATDVEGKVIDESLSDPRDDNDFTAESKLM